MTTHTTIPGAAKIGRPPAHSDAQIREAGNAIEAEGRRVTGFALRARLGSGDPKRLLAVWQAKRHQREGAEGCDTDVPSDFQDTVKGLSDRVAGEIGTLAKQLFAHASQIAEARLTEERKQLGEHRSELDAEAEDAAKLIEDLEAKVADLQAELREAREATARADQRANALDKKLAVAEARLSDNRDTVAVLRKERDIAIEHRDVWFDDAAEAHDDLQRLQEANACLRERLAAFDAVCGCAMKRDKADSTPQPDNRPTPPNPTGRNEERNCERKEERKDPAQARAKQAPTRSDPQRQATHGTTDADRATRQPPSSV